MSWKAKIHRFFEWVPLGSAGTFVAIISLLSREIQFMYRSYDIPFIISLFLVILLIVLLIGKRLIPSITVFAYDEHNNKRKLADFDSLDASSGEIKIDLVFEVPSHHNSVYVSFDVKEYTVGIDQYTPVNYDYDRAITYHSSIPKFELTLRLTPNSNEANQGSELPLEIIDKLHNRTVCEIPVKG